ncbi:hypothetical protein [Paraferrimonas haliotis]|uniref:Uncharacterized protein n=1 Tax=Paraferrimonas haliotis TaxID=2013866 RepID=A0AA37WW47_9GAMM|nr:hypothetical protein [Paraferrimonas haliotis]GLS83253.1 hypothetical protein GCM10007894_12300 [Paraferrimonas haliotis]
MTQTTEQTVELEAHYLDLESWVYALAKGHPARTEYEQMKQRLADIDTADKEAKTEYPCPCRFKKLGE